MENFDFALFYDNQSDYAEFRNDPSKREDYSVIVDWKVRKLIQLLPADFRISNILEVGCAFGVLLNNIADKLHLESRIGIDISGNNIEAAKKLFPECKFFHGTLDEFLKSLPGGAQSHQFDIIVLSDIIEHIPDDLEFLNTVRKTCPNVLLNLPLEKSFITRNRIYGEQDPSGHLRCYDKKDAIQLVNKAGFEIVNSFTAISFTDKQVFELYTKNRRSRVRAKPIPRRLFWTLVYFFEDRLKLINKRFSERIFGTNYFALLKSIN